MPTYDGSLDDRTGYDPLFIGPRVEAPRLLDAADALLLNDAPVIHYMRFSLSLSRSRKLARWVAWNIDGSTLPHSNDKSPDGLRRDDLSFRNDPRLDRRDQTPASTYDDNRLDRGHIARRADLLWGDPDDAEKANRDSFYLTNITPQMDNFNQSRLQGVWGCLENAVLNQVVDDNSHVSVMAGPVLSPEDQPYRKVLVPREFWKVLIYQRDNELRSRGFIVTQKLLGLRRAVSPLDEFHVYERSLALIASKACVSFDSALPAAQQRGRRAPRRRAQADKPIDNINDIAW